MPSFSEFKRQGYKLQRCASHGAAITLVAACGKYTATFECATKCAEVLGDRELRNVGDGILDNVPSYSIRVEDMLASLEKLAQRYSIALVEFTTTEKTGDRFVCVWRINAGSPETYRIDTASPEQPPKASTNVDDY